MKRSLTTLCLLFTVLALAACDEDECETCPPVDRSPLPTIENVWPNEDGRQWTFDFTYATDEGSMTAFADSFTIEDVDSLLRVPLPAETEIVSNDLWRLRFDGTTTTDSGARGQFLRGFLFEDRGGVRLEIPSDFASWTTTLLQRRRPLGEEGFARRIDAVGGLMLDGDRVFTKNAERTDELGNVIDRTRAYPVGRIEYAPGVGPVFDVERFFGAAENGIAGSEGVAEARFELIGTRVTVPEPAVREAGPVGRTSVPWRPDLPPGR